MPTAQAPSKLKAGQPSQKRKEIIVLDSSSDDDEVPQNCMHDSFSHTEEPESDYENAHAALILDNIENVGSFPLYRFSVTASDYEISGPLCHRLLIE